jgi:D-glycero-alpha-D-manno-heptose-7-phosphate kinase
MTIESSAPTRVDLAGGTIDIWPLYLLHRGALSVNFAIDLPARCRIRRRDDGRFVFRSKDTAEAIEIERLEDLWSTSTLPLLAKLTYFFAPPSGIEMETDCTAPAGSGLAGSSALNIAICGALDKATGHGYRLEELIRVAKNVEAQVIRVPTGDQDYYPAAYGGVQAVHLSAGGVTHERIEVDPGRLAARLVLIYSGRQRNSGINNWDVMKRHIDGDATVSQAFEGIITAARQVRRALCEGRLDELDAAFELEWTNRRLLSDGIVTPEIEAVIARARSLGAGAAKICGAGGGGCVLMTVPEGRRGDIQGKLLAAGVQVINFNIAGRGLQLV